MTDRRRRAYRLMPVLALVLIVSACAAGANPSVDVAAADGDLAGFWFGLWHGVIAPVTFVISLFSDTVSVYEVHNNGNWYDFGFMLGFTSLSGGGAGSRRRSRR